jgi:hypothetical protein
MPLPRSLTAVPRDRHVHQEIADAIRTLFAPDAEQGCRQYANSANAMRERDLIKQLLREIPSEFAPVLHAELLKAGYNPSEPRLPAGDPYGGEWTRDGASGNGHADSTSFSSPTPPSGDGVVISDATPDNVWRPGAQYAQVGSPSRLSARDIPADNPKHPVPLIDSNGRPITDDQGNPLLRPADLPPEMFVRAGLDAAQTSAATAATVGPDAASVYQAVLGLAQELQQFQHNGAWDAERVQGQYVSDYTDYATIAIGLYCAAAGLPFYAALLIQLTYTAKQGRLLTAREIRDTQIGYELYQSGRVLPGP